MIVEIRLQTKKDGRTAEPRIEFIHSNFRRQGGNTLDNGKRPHVRGLNLPKANDFSAGCTKAREIETQKSHVVIILSLLLYHLGKNIPDISIELNSNGSCLRKTFLCVIDTPIAADNIENPDDFFFNIIYPASI